MKRGLATTLRAGLLVLATGVAGASGQAPGQPLSQAPSQTPAGQEPIAPIPKRCEMPGAVAADQPVLTNVAKAMRTRKRIVILAIGGTSATALGPIAGGNFAVVERLLESTFKSVDVHIVHRGVSGELAADASRRIRNEVALTGADLVLWQVGTADAMARVDPDTLRVAVDETLGWLKAHEIDVIMVGMRYAKSLAKDPWYQATRKIVADVAARHGVFRINRYSAEETLAGVKRGDDPTSTAVEASEASYNCTAEYLARAIAAGLFLRSRQPGDTQLPRRTP